MAHKQHNEAYPKYNRGLYHFLSFIQILRLLVQLTILVGDEVEHQEVERDTQFALVGVGGRLGDEPLVALTLVSSRDSCLSET